MKHLLFVAISSGIFSGTSLSLKAQNHTNTERFAGMVQPGIPLKFIEDISFVPESTSDMFLGWSDRPASGVLTTISPSSSLENCSSLQFKYATLMDREVENVTNLNLYHFIDDWWATRYQYGGTDRKGIDCSAFTGKLLSEVYCVTVPRTAREQFKACEKVEVESLREGDLVFFNTRGGVSHVGLYLGDNYFVHTSVHDGVTISSLSDDYYSKRFISGGRVSTATEGSDIVAVANSEPECQPSE